MGQAGVPEFSELGIAKLRHGAQLFDLRNNEGSAYYVDLSQTARDGEII